MSVIGQVNANILVIISGYFLSLREIALIGFIMSFASAITIIATAVQLNFNPVFAKHNKQGSKSEVEHKIEQIYKTTTLTSVPICIAVVLSYYIYTTFFMGANFAHSYMYFSIVAIGAILTYFSQWNTSMLLLSGEFKGEMFRVISVLLLKLLITFTFTKYIGFVGNLLAYTVVEVYSVTINMLLVKRFLGYNLLKLSYSWK
jgi:O-antigen/teichoic acid export membrane protein